MCFSSTGSGQVILLVLVVLKVSYQSTAVPSLFINVIIEVTLYPSPILKLIYGRFLTNSAINSPETFSFNTQVPEIFIVAVSAPLASIPFNPYPPSDFGL